MAPDLKQNLVVTAYLLFSHNSLVIAYFSGLILSILLSLWKPSRFTILLTIAFAILLFSYEYDKHIIAALREQTVNSLITITPHNRLRKMIDLFLSDLVPILLYILGWGAMYLAIVLATIRFYERERK